MSRDDQLAYRTSKKAGRKKKNNTKNKKPKGSPRKSKLEKLRRIKSNAELGVPAECSDWIDPKAKKKKKSASQASFTSPEPESSRKRSKLPAAAPKAKANKPRKARCSGEFEATVHPTCVEKLVAWTHTLSLPASGPHDLEALKVAVRSTLPSWELAQLNVYWTRGGCGVKHVTAEKGCGYFSFKSHGDMDIHHGQQIMAIACAICTVS